MEIFPARVSEAKIEIQKDNFLVLELRFDFDGVGMRCVIAPVLDEYDKDLKKRVGTAKGADYIRSVFKFFNAEKVEDIVGQYVMLHHDGQYPVGFEKLSCDEPSTEAPNPFMIDQFFKSSPLLNCT